MQKKIVRDSPITMHYFTMKKSVLDPLNHPSSSSQRQSTVQVEPVPMELSLESELGGLGEDSIEISTIACFELSLYFIWWEKKEMRKLA